MSYKPEYMWLCGKNTAINSIVAQVYAISKDCIQSIYKQVYFSKTFQSASHLLYVYKSDVYFTRIVTFQTPII